MKILHVVECADIARVFVLQMREARWSAIECVGSRDPRVTLSEKMVLMVSTQFGCPVACLMCDAGAQFHGNLTSAEILSQIHFLLDNWAPPFAGACPKFKIQFARMGEPAFNDAVLETLAFLKRENRLSGLMPCITTTAPRGRSMWFEELIRIKDRDYPNGRFQLQFSVQSTDEADRDRLIPIKKWNLRRIARFTRRFWRVGDRKITLNFAAIQGVRIDPGVVAASFDPNICLVKITPLNATANADRHGLLSRITRVDDQETLALAEEFRSHGFDCIVSIGQPEESEMQTSCGQLVRSVAAGYARIEPDSQRPHAIL